MIIRDILNGKRNECTRRALTSDVKRAKVLALAFRKNGTLIASSTNKLSLGDSNRFTYHAEEYLVHKLNKIKAKQRFGDITVLVMRFSRKHGWRLARPCSNCQRILERYGVDTILFTVNNELVEQI